MAYTKEELIALGFSAEDADALTKNESSGGASSPFQKLSMNYSDIITDEANVKKGNFIFGFVEDKKTLTLKESGTDLGAEIEFYAVMSNTFQCSQFDVATSSNVFLTKFYSDSYSTKSQADKKTGVTVEQRREEGHRVTFNQILLMMVKVDGEFTPFVHYLHGTSYNQLHSQLEALGATLNLKTLFKARAKKVPTNFQPAWCFDITEVINREADIPKSIATVSSAIKAFNTWVDKSNAQGSSSTAEAPKAKSQMPVVDIDEDDIAF